ncbi:hypothetical protein LJC18_02365 [Lachnospiraceae bacterium OttesenSCG-928-E19]|nr:hypothetical protein [Lachnospiraceae bacterium OttesenSCG-928-E19]
MANLHYLYGPMGASKTGKLIETALGFQRKNVQYEAIKPAKDVRFAENEIVSRSGQRIPALTLPNLSGYTPKPGTKFLLLDEIQFFPPTDIDKLVYFADVQGIITMCYGLLIDSNEQMFETSKRLIEVGAKLHQLECSCEIGDCLNKASHNLRFDGNNNVIQNGQQFCLGSDNFKGVCRDHYYKMYYGRGK